MLKHAQKRPETWEHGRIHAPIHLPSPIQQAGKCQSILGISNPPTHSGLFQVLLCSKSLQPSPIQQALFNQQLHSRMHEPLDNISKHSRSFQKTAQIIP